MTLSVNQRKQKLLVCEKYKGYLELLYHLGNKIMLQTQLEQYARAMNLAKAHSTFMYHIKELKENEIIKTEPFFINNRTTQHHIIVLKKFAIRFMKGYTDIGGSQKVAPVSPLKSNDRILTTTFKNEFILTKAIPRILSKQEKVGFQDIENYLANHMSSLFVPKNKGMEYAKTFQRNLEGFIDKDIFQRKLDLLEVVSKNRNKGLLKGSQSTKGKGSPQIAESEVKKGNKEEISVSNQKQSDKKKAENEGVVETSDGRFYSAFTASSKKEEKIQNYTFEQMIRANLHIIGLRRKENEAMNVHAVLLDVGNSQNLYAFGTHIACLYRMIRDVTTVEIKLSVGIIGFDAEAMANMETSSKETVRNPYKQIDEERMIQTLKNWGCEASDLLNIDIKYSHYDITNKYLEGKKFANLKKNRSKVEAQATTPFINPNV